MFDHSVFKRVFDETGLTKAELASIYGVSRQTLYNWYAGDGPTQALLAEREKAYSWALWSAIKKGVLPIRKLGPERAERVLKMKQALHALTAPK